MASSRIRFTSLTTGASSALFSRSTMLVASSPSSMTEMSESSKPCITSSRSGPFSA